MSGIDDIDEVTDIKELNDLDQLLSDIKNEINQLKLKISTKLQAADSMYKVDFDFNLDIYKQYISTYGINELGDILFKNYDKDEDL